MLLILTSSVLRWFDKLDEESTVILMGCGFMELLFELIIVGSFLAK